MGGHDRAGKGGGQSIGGVLGRVVGVSLSS